MLCGKKIKIHPWIGSDYKYSGLLPYRTLILGESNYSKVGEYRPRLVVELIKEHLGGGGDSNFSRFATKIKRVVFGEETSVKDSDFWKSTAFYNFVQYRVGDAARERPTKEMWDYSVEAFEELVSNIEPERILVLGLSNWKNLLAHLDHEDFDEHRAVFKVGDHRVIAGCIVHPSAGGGHFKYKKCVPIAEKVVLSPL